MAAAKRRRRAFGYDRVSQVNGRDVESESFHSVDMQNEDSAAVARRFDVSIIDTYVELDKSGGDSERPLLNDAVARIERGDAECLVGPRIDRVARSAKDMLDIIDRVKAAGGSVIVGSPMLDTDDPSSELIITILAAVAQMELRLKTEMWERITQRVTKAGRRIGSAPIGYQLVEKRRLEPDPDTAHLIRPLFELRARGASWTRIRDWWHSETGRRMNVATFRYAIGNRTYLGEMHYGDFAATGTHEALVDRRLFDAAQHAEAARPARSDIPPTLMRGGTIICASCGRPMTGGTSRGKRTYRCKTRQLAGEACPNPVVIMAAAVDKHVWEQTREHLRSLEQQLYVTTGGDDTELRDVERERGDAIAELDAYTLVISARSNPSLFQTGLDERERRVELVEERYQAALTRRARAGVRIDVSRAIASDDVTMGERQELVRATVRATVHPSRPRLPLVARIDLGWLDTGDVTAAGS